MVKAKEFKALEALEYPWRSFCRLKKAHFLRWTQRDCNGVVQESMKTESGKDVVDISFHSGHLGLRVGSWIVQAYTTLPQWLWSQFTIIAFTQINLQHSKSLID